MKENTSTKRRRITRFAFVRTLAMILSIMILIVSIGIVSIIPAGAHGLSGASYVGVIVKNNDDSNGRVNEQAINFSDVWIDCIHDGSTQKWEGMAYFRVNYGSDAWGYKYKYVLNWGSNGYYSNNGHSRYANDSNDWLWLGTSDNNYMTLNVYGNDSNANAARDSSGYSYRVVYFKITGQDGTDYVQEQVYCAQVNKLAVSYTTSTASVTCGSEVDVYPDSLSGGTGNYNVTYSIKKDGSSVSSSDYIDSSNKFQAAVPGTYVVTASLRDTTLTGITAATCTKTITVSGYASAKWYIAGLEDFGGTTTGTNNQMTYNSSDNSYSIDVYLKPYNNESDGKGNGKFCLKNDNGTVTGPVAENDFVLNASNYTTAVTMTNTGEKWFNFGSNGSGPPAGYYTIKWTPSTMKLKLTSNSAGMAKVWAKDGAAGSDSSSSKYGFAHVADTTITAVSGTPATKAGKSVTTIGSDSSSGYETSYVTKGHTVTVKTTINSTWKSRIYVKAFNVNGVSKQVINSSQANTSTGVYTYTYAVPANFSGTNVEITPVYYYLDSYKTNNSITTVTYYMEGFDGFDNTLKTKWGDTMYAYPFYGTLGGYDGSFGSYPGQPFIYVDGKYSVEVPVNKNVSINSGVGSTKIKGITVNNGYDDYVHKTINGWSSSSDHVQTYDSDGFYKIYNECKDSNDLSPTVITQRFKIESTTNNRNTYGGDSKTTWGYTNNTPTTSYNYASSKTLVDNISSGNGWELYTDSYGRPIDLFGHVIGNNYVAANEASNAAVRVISSGYIPNIAGDYGSAWLVYYPTTLSGGSTLYNGNYVASGGYTLEYDTTKSKYSIPPSIFMMKNADSFNTSTYPDIASRTVESLTYTDSVNNYKTMYNNLNGGSHDVRGKYVYISYEKNAQIHANTGAYRVDTRWYYSFASDKVNSNILIEYSGDGSTWTEDTFVEGYNGLYNQGANSGCRAYFTNEDFDGETESGDILINTLDYTFTAVAGSHGGTDYMFKGWYLKDSDGTYTPIDTNGSVSGTLLNSANETLVARFLPIADGNLNIAHKASVDGIADTKVQVKVYSSNGGTELYDSGEVSNGVLLDSTYISNSHSSYYITVKLLTTPLALNTFTSWSYDAFNTAKSISATTNTLSATKTSTFSFTVGQLYSDVTQTYKNLSYTSNVSAWNTTGSYNYKYTDRFGSRQTYTSTIYVTSAENTAGHPDCSDAVTVYTKNSSNDYDSITDAMAARAPSSNVINVYQKTLDFGIKNLGSAWDASTYGALPAGETAIANNATYSSGAINVYATPANPSYTLTYNYYNTSDVLTSSSASQTYGSPLKVNTAVMAASHGGNAFIGWSTVNNDASKIISPYQQFGMILSKNMTVYAIYGTPTNTWKAYIDMITANRENANAQLAMLCRYTNLSVEDIPGGSTCGLIFVTGKVDLSEYMSSDYTDTSTGKYTANLIGQANGTQRWASKANGVLASNYTFSSLSDLNRAELILTANYADVASTNFATYSYIKLSNGTVYISDITYGTYTGGAN